MPVTSDTTALEQQALSRLNLKSSPISVGFVLHTRQQVPKHFFAVAGKRREINLGSGLASCHRAASASRWYRGNRAG